MTLYTINTSVANIYREPGFKSDVISQALLGENCELLEKSGDWIRIRQNDGYEGWIYYFHGVQREEPYSGKFRVYDLYSMITDTHGAPIRMVTVGNRLDAHEEKNGFHIILPDGSTGIIKAQLEREYPSPERLKIVEMAKRFLGVQYQWGGKSGLGVDCSGLVQIVLNMFGIQLPRDSYQQYDFLKKDEVKPAESQPGDLVFFKQSSERVTHVGMSLGGLDLIHSQGWVKIQTLNEESSLECNQALKDILFKTCSIQSLLNQ